MTVLKETGWLLYREFLFEWRQKYAFQSILLYVAGAVFVCYLSVKVLNPPVWNSLLWIIMLFVAINAISRSFAQEGRGRMLYYYQLCRPESMIISKILYNYLQMILLSALCYGAFSLFQGNPVQAPFAYWLCLVLGSMGFSGTFTMANAITTQSGQGPLLMPILSFPLIIPTLLISIRAGKKAMDGLDFSTISPDLGALLLLNIALVILSWVLYPFLWRR